MPSNLIMGENSTADALPAMYRYSPSTFGTSREVLNMPDDQSRKSNHDTSDTPDTQNTIFPAAQSWKDNAAFSIPARDAEGPAIPISEAGESSAVVDHGDSRQLLSSAKAHRQAKERVWDDPAELTRGAGAHLDANVPTTTVPLQVADDQSQQSDSTGKKSREVNVDLESRIRRAQEGTKRNGKKFVPFDKLDQIITKEAVHQELKLHFSDKPPRELDHLTSEICEVVHKGPGPASSNSYGLTTRRKIFGILVRIAQTMRITSFIKERLYDCHLPFYFLSDQDGNQAAYRKNTHGDMVPIECFASWKQVERENFEAYQWEFQAPYFKVLSSGQHEAPLHYEFEDLTVLPFFEEDEDDRPPETHSLISSGFSEVWRTKIHRAHHSHPSEKNPYFAVKRLRSNGVDTKLFQREVATLKRLSVHNNDHLMKLQLTYKFKDRFHLLFDWADGNLRDHWERYPNPTDIPRTHEFATWAAEQWLGLSQALLAVHLCPPDQRVSPYEQQRGDGLDNQRTNGRHGDIKPENLLWFSSSGKAQKSCSVCYGKIVLADFGLTEFHRDETGIVNAVNVARSPTYRAPEYDISKTISQSYDIWSLGCVLLEFVTWYLEGFEAYDQFSKDRVADDNNIIREDVYFKVVIKRRDDVDGRNSRSAILKESVVKQFEELRKVPKITQMLLDILDFVESKMLRMVPDTRASCAEVVEKFEEIHGKSSRDKNYTSCLEKVPPKRERAATDLSSLSEPYQEVKENDENPSTGGGAPNDILGRDFQPPAQAINAPPIALHQQPRLPGATYLHADTPETQTPRNYSQDCDSRDFDRGKQPLGSVPMNKWTSGWSWIRQKMKRCSCFRS